MKLRHVKVVFFRKNRIVKILDRNPIHFYFRSAYIKVNKLNLPLMKKSLTFLSFVFLTNIVLFSQSIIPIPNDSGYVSAVVPADEFEPVDCHLYIKNNHGTATTFTWGLKDYAAPSGWELKLCDNNNCYDLLIGNNKHESLLVNAGDTMDMKFQFSPHLIAGSGSVNVVIYVTDDSAATAIVLNYGANFSSGLNSVSPLSQSNFKIFPNPVKNSFTVFGLENSGNLSLEIYDMKGASVHSEIIGATHNQIEISVNHLAKGDYLLKAYSKSGQVLGTSRLTKID